MKISKVALFFLFTISVAGLSAQNLQLHFDPRSSIHGKDNFDKNYLTATFEMFKPDKWGSTFMFVDFDFKGNNGDIAVAYAEIARDQKLGKLPIAAHVEFNGGLGSGYYANNPGIGFSISNAYLAGASYATKAGNFNLSTYVAYKYNAFKNCSNDVQWTGVWGGNFANDKLSFNGFIDVWTENKTKDKSFADLGKGKEVVLLIEPQLWYNATPNLSVGTEIEISDNFAPNNKFYINPTIAAKWNF